MRRKKHIYLIAVLFMIAALFAVRLAVNESLAHVEPRIGRENISSLLEKQNFTDEDYRTILEQTGIGKSAVDELKTSVYFAQMMLEFQEQYFAPAFWRCEFIFPTTKEESLTYENGSNRFIEFVPVHNGDIIITRATHTLGWRHGHAAIVTDAENEETLESVLLGQKSSFQDLTKWRNYPSVLVLRPKDEEIGEIAAQFAKQYLSGVDYSMFVGLKKKDKQTQDPIDSTQCAHLVWQAYRAAGLDIDSNGGWLVIPKDIANCKELEVVQAFGFDPDKRWQ